MPRTREEIDVEVRRKGATTFIQLEVFLDIRDLLQELLEAINDNRK